MDHPSEMDLDAPAHQGPVAGELAGERVPRSSAPFTPPASTRTTPQRAVVVVGSSSSSSDNRHAVRPADISMDGADQEQDPDHDQDQELGWGYDTGRQRGFGHHGSLAEEGDETGKIEHEDFYNSFGNDWHQPQ
ncbi:hypothetical protein H4R19_006263 [Coemansia spiralis]|nr:hypothetical protein H4R19_006263 [Coemansia spiralis]